MKVNGMKMRAKTSRFARRAFMLVMVVFLVGLSVTATTLMVRQVSDVQRLSQEMTQRAVERWK